MPTSVMHQVWKVVSVIENLQPAESDCVCAPYSVNQIFTNAGLTDKVIALAMNTFKFQLYLKFKHWHTLVLPYLTNGSYPSSKDKLTASSKKTCSVSNLGADFWSNSMTSMLGLEARCVITKGQIACGRQTCSDFSLHWLPAQKCCLGYMEQYSGIGYSWAGIVWSILQLYYFQSHLFLFIYSASVLLGTYWASGF